MTQTAIEILIEELERHHYSFIGFKESIKLAKSIEKQQIIDARVTAPLINTPFESEYKKEAEQYYKNTFNK